MLPSLDNIPMQKKLRYQLILSRNIDIKESCILTGREVCLATPNQKLWSHMPPSLDGYLPSLDGYQIILPRFIDGQKIRLSDWKGGTTGYTQPNVVIWDATLSWWLSPFKKLWYQLILSADIDNKRIPSFW